MYCTPKLLHFLGCFGCGIRVEPFSSPMGCRFSRTFRGASAIPSMIVGMGCMFIAGYGKTSGLPRGFVRETVF